MWICTNKGFLSIVADRNNPDHMMVRARAKGHIAALFPGEQETVTPDADYRFRALIPRSRVIQMIRQQIEALEYTNFKDSVDDQELHNAYLAFWGTMHALQNKLVNKVVPPVQSKPRKGRLPGSKGLS